MEFPDYSIYVEAIATRNLLILFVGGCVGADLGVLALLHYIDPVWSRRAIWVLGIGVYYATLVLVVVYWGSLTAAG